jgi:uncharacterized protein
MVYKKLSDNRFVIRIKRKEEIIGELKKFCLKEKIEGGFFYGLGAVDSAELAHYDVATKKYTSKKFSIPMEMTNITGSIGICDAELVIHAHATFSDKQMVVIGGHLVEAIVSGTAEINFIKTSKLIKFLDSETGLKIFKF